MKIETYWEGVAGTLPDKEQQEYWKKYISGEVILVQKKTGKAANGFNVFAYQAIYR